MNQTKSDENKVGLWDVAKSVGAAFFGVQSAKNREPRTRLYAWQGISLHYRGSDSDAVVYPKNRDQEE